MRLHVPPSPQKPDDIEFEGSFRAVAYPFVEPAVCVAVLGGDEFEYVAADDVFRGWRLDHRKPRRIHLQQSAVPRDELYAFRRRFHDRAQPLLALAQLGFRVLARADVERCANDADARAAVVEDAAALRRNPAQDPVLLADRAVLDVVQ